MVISFTGVPYSLLGGDGVNDVQPSGVVGAGEAANRPIHTLAIAVLGVPLVDNAYLEDVAREAASRKRWEFLTTVQFTRVPGERRVRSTRLPRSRNRSLAVAAQFPRSAVAYGAPRPMSRPAVFPATGVRGCASTLSESCRSALQFRFLTPR